MHSFRTENKLKSQEKVCQNKDFCGIVMPSEKDNILEFNQIMKSDKMPYSSVKWGLLGHFDPNSTNTILSTNPMGSSGTL